MLISPALAIDPVANQMGHDAVSEITGSGLVWCMEPIRSTCDRIRVMTEPVKHNPRYDVIERWDEETILITHSGGVLRGDGMICATGFAQIETADATDLDGVLVSEERLEEIKAAMREMKAGGELTEYCYAYVPSEAAGFELYHEIYFAGGQRSDAVSTFRVDNSPNSLERLTIRPLK